MSKARELGLRPPHSFHCKEEMGNNVSTSAFDPAHVRIYTNVLQLKNPALRIQMIQTCLAGPEYIQTAKRAGVYSYLLNYISSVQSGSTPPMLPGEQSAVHQQTLGQQQYHAQQPVQTQSMPQPRSLNSFQNPIVYPKETERIALPALQNNRTAYNNHGPTQISQYQEKPESSWSQLSKTPQQKMVSYFSSCLEVLGIQEEVTLTEEALKKAYKRASLKAHPDKGGSEEQFEAITRAYAYLSEILKRIQGGRTGGLKEVEAPQALKSGRKEESTAWQHLEPVKLNPKNLDMNAFNNMFEKTHMVDPDNDGYGDWLKDEVGDKSSAKFSGKFNRDVFNKMFDAEARSKAKTSNQLIHPEAMAMTLAPNMGLELGRERPDTFTPAPNSKQQFSDLMDAYSRETTISDKVANVQVEARSLDLYRTSRERAPDPLSHHEQTQLQEAERQMKQREQQRQLRAANQGIQENQYFERMKQLVLTDKR
jgi:curved DNA-binding protein CbpA